MNGKAATAIGGKPAVARVDVVLIKNRSGSRAAPVRSAKQDILLDASV